MPETNNHKKRISARQLLWAMAGMAAALLITTVIVQPWNRGPRLSAAASRSEITKADPANEVDSPSASAAAITKPGVRKTGLAASHMPEPAASAPATLTGAQVETRAAELMQLAMNDDAASLETILKELRNPNPAIRHAALQAAIQFGSRDALPAIEQAAQDTDDASEKTQLLGAIAFLKLPSLSEVMLQKRSAGTPATASVSAR
jgi:HEAT repeat protein